MGADRLRRGDLSHPIRPLEGSLEWKQKVSPSGLGPDNIFSTSRHISGINSVMYKQARVMPSLQPLVGRMCFDE